LTYKLCVGVCIEHVLDYTSTFSGKFKTY